MQSKISALSLAVSELTHAYILEPQEVLREKIIECHLLISEIAYKGDPGLDAARVANQEPFRPVLPNPEIKPPSVTFNPDTNQDEPAQQGNQPHESQIKPDDWYVIKWMGNYWQGGVRAWVRELGGASRFSSFDLAAKQIEKMNMSFAFHQPPGTALPGFEAVSYSSEAQRIEQIPLESLGVKQDSTLSDVSDSLTESELS